MKVLYLYCFLEIFDANFTFRIEENWKLQHVENKFQTCMLFSNLQNTLLKEDMQMFLCACKFFIIRNYF